MDTNTRETHARHPICGGYRLRPVAGYNIETRCRVCGWNPIAIHPESGTSSLGGTETCHRLSRINEGFMAYFWWEDPKFRRRFLRCGLGHPEASALNLGVFIPYRAWGRGWSSKKQQIIALSTVESEYIAQAHAAKEALWLRTFIAELCGEDAQPLTINCDNQGAIALLKDNKFHARTKHINIRYHFIREAIEDQKVSVIYLPTDDNPADIFTKPLAKAKFRRFVEMLGLRRMESGR